MANQRTPASKWIVNYWHIPGGCDYDNARIILAYFDTEGEADEFAKDKRYPPEMAYVYTVKSHDALLQKYKERNII